MSVLPDHPDLGQARRQAKELLQAARDGDAGALARLAAVSAPLTLAGAQLALARELGQPSWAALVRIAPMRSETLLASLYAAGGTWCLEMLTKAAAGAPELLTEALVVAVAGADLDAVGVLLSAGADPDAPGPDGRSARRRALTAGVALTVELLGGGGDDPVDRLLEAILTGDRDGARGLAAADPGLVGRLEPADRAALIAAAGRGDQAAVGLMLELGFPIGARREASDEDGATALHAAAYAGADETVALLLDHGADLGAHDTRWHSQPVEWALVGSGEAPDSAPDPDWVATVALLLDAGGSLDGVTFDPEESKQPSAAVLDLLRFRGVGADRETG